MSEAMEIAEQQKVTIEEIWKILRENAEAMKELREAQKETDRVIKENAAAQKETSQQIKETDQQMKEYNKRFGDFTNRFGEVIESMIAPNLLDQFYELGFDFQQANRNTKITNKKLQIFLEIDCLLENGEKAILVEMKTELETKDVKKHIEQLEKMRIHADSRGDKRAFMGAVAGVVTTPVVKEFALAQGLFVLEPAGETFNVIPPNGAPQEW